MFTIKKVPIRDQVDVSSLIVVRKKTSTIKKVLSTPEARKPASTRHNGNNYGTSLLRPAAVIKTEVLDDAFFLEDEGSVGPGCSPHSNVCVKQELDIGPTELQPPDVCYTLQSCKPDPDYCDPLRITEDVPQGKEPLLLKEEDTIRPLSSELVRNSPGILPQGQLRTPKRLNGPMPLHDAQRAEAMPQPAYTFLSKRINLNFFELMVHAPGISSPIVHQGITHRYDVNAANQTKSHGQSASSNVNFKESQCFFCHKVISWKSNLLDHMRVHHQFNSSQLTQQEISLTNPCENLDGHPLHKRLLHKLKTRQETFECVSRGKKFSRTSALPVRDAGVKPFKCKSCGNRFSTMSTLSRHGLVHVAGRPFECNSCGKTFKYKGGLKRHIPIHASEKPFKCESCGKMFTRANNFANHLKIHAGEKPFECKCCGKTFTQGCNLIMHMRVHTGEKPAECKSCGKRFRQSSHLTRHMLVHAGQKPFQCESCGKRFNQNSNLTIHMRLHSGDKPFECNFCGRKFAAKSSLIIHIRVHISEKSFKYKSCKETFTQESHLAAHRRMHANKTKRKFGKVK